MRRRVVLGATAAIAAVLCFGCGQIPTGTSRNQALCPTQVDCVAERRAAAQASSAPQAVGQSARPRADRSHLDAGVERSRSTFEVEDKFQPKVFVGLALSGGGSRAANFALAAMEQLEQLGMLEHVTAISSTSGGGLPAAYYALHGAQMYGPQGESLWQEAKGKMRHDFRDEWLVRWLLPWNLAQTSFTHYDRSDLMADIFDRRLFNGATFAKLANMPSARRPMWIANATRLGASSGGLFSFTEESFRGIGSDLSSFPIAQAVMASAAFPGAFNSVTLHNYPLLPRVISERIGRQVPHGYVHVMDGGPADNLGVESLLRLAASSSYRSLVPNQPFVPMQLPAMQRSPQVPCLIIVVDAFPDGVSGLNDYKPDPRTFKDHFVDFNFMSAFDAFLGRRRSDFLTLSGLRTLDRQLGPEIPISIRPEGGFGPYPTSPANRFSSVEFPLPARFSPVGSPLNERNDPLDVVPQVRPARSCATTQGADCHEVDTGVCSIWHVALDNIASMPVARRGADGAWKNVRVKPQGVEDDPAFSYRTKLRWVTSQIDTDFKLAGPPGCDAKFLQDALYAAARVAFREDDRYRPKACQWPESVTSPR